MPTFSERYGYTPVRSVMQREAADEDLRTALWNALTIYYFQNLKSTPFAKLIKNLWIDFYKQRLDEFYLESAFSVTRDSFISGPWFRMFDLLEIIPNIHYYITADNARLQDFIAYSNSILKKHLSAYRFLNNKIVEITSDEEIAEIEQAINTTNDELTPVKSHLKRALELLSDRSTPDYRNSIKESISAVESLSRIITQEPNATLSKALKIIEKIHNLHPCLKGAFAKLYEYTSDSDGIRHALLEESTLKQEDAKFMLVACSAFVNYLIQKTNLE